MFKNSLTLILFLTLFTIAAHAAQRVVQTEIVDFPNSGRVRIEAREENGAFPRLVFISSRTGKVLLSSAFEDSEKVLIREADDIPSNPQVGFLTVRSRGFQRPLIMATAVAYGGSDNQYFLTIFGEENGKISRLNESLLSINVQGGFYLGRLNRKFGYGLAVWDFIWGDDADESHYAPHHYEMTIYKLKNGKFERVLKRNSSRKYDSDKSSQAWRELGVRVFDQRKNVRQIKESF